MAANQVFFIGYPAHRCRKSTNTSFDRMRWTLCAVLSCRYGVFPLLILNIKSLQVVWRGGAIEGEAVALCIMGPLVLPWNILPVSSLPTVRHVNDRSLNGTLSMISSGFVFAAMLMMFWIVVFVFPVMTCASGLSMTTTASPSFTSLPVLNNGAFISSNVCTSLAAGGIRSNGISP